MKPERKAVPDGAYDREDGEDDGVYRGEYDKGDEAFVGEEEIYERKQKKESRGDGYIW